MEESASKEISAPNFPSECPRCGNEGPIRDYGRGEIICDVCGFVVEEGLKDRGPEWRSFDQEEHEEKSRVGPPSTQTIHDKGLSTQIDYKNRDAKGSQLSPGKRQKAYRLRKQQKRGKVSSSKDRNLAFSLSEINRMGSQLGLSKSVQEIASKIYRNAVEEDLIRGRSMEGVASAALYAACREADVPRTLEEVAEASRVGAGKIGKNYRFIARELDIHFPPTDPVRYVPRFASELGISGETRVEAMKIIREAREQNLTSGKSPSGVAAAATYIAALKSGARKTQVEVANAADVTEVTVRNQYKEIAEKLGIDMDELKARSNPGNKGSESENPAEADKQDCGGENPLRSSSNSPLVGWMEKNLYLYKILSGVEESPKSHKKLALENKLTYTGVENRVCALAEKGLVRVGGNDSTEVQITEKGRETLDQMALKLTGDGEGNAVVVKE